MAHTKGPWRAVGTEIVSLACSDDDCVVAEVFSEDYKDDAALIAAAPELLRTLRSIADDLNAMDLDSNGWRTWDATQVDAVVAGALRRADEAIAKAEGRTDEQ